METTDLENDVAYLKSLNRTYKSQIDELRYKEQQDWFITLEFYLQGESSSGVLGKLR